MEFKVGDFVTGISNGEVCCIGIVKEHVEKGRLLTYALLDLKSGEILQVEIRFSEGSIRFSKENEKRLLLDKLIHI